MEQAFELIRSGQARTRADLAAATGLTRATVSQRVEALIGAGLVYESGGGRSTGGRPPVMLEFNKSAGVLLAADLGATHCRLAVANLSGVPLVELAADLEISEGPDEVLGWVRERFVELLAGAGRGVEEVWGVGIGLPGPVDFARGRVVNPPVMPGWHDFPVSERLEEHFSGVPVLVENDANMMALGEQRVEWPNREHLMFIKVATGIGCGIVAGGSIHRGEQGAAGDIGHLRISGYDEAICLCGNASCVEAVASGWAMVRQLGAQGIGVRNSREVVRLVREGNPAATRLVRRSGELIGDVLAGAVSFFNPSVVVVGGDVADAEEHLFAGMRAAVYHRSLPLATRHLKIVPSALGDRAGVYGAATMVAEQILPLVAAEAGTTGRRSTVGKFRVSRELALEVERKEEA